jgi:hypothetical protein
MRKIAASLIMPVSSPPLRNGLVILDDAGRIEELIDTDGQLKESSHLEFYNGIITPGFVLPWYRPSGLADTFTAASFRDLDRLLQQRGIKGLGIVVKGNCHFAIKKDSPVTYHTILELCPGQEQEEFEIYQEGLDIITDGWNEYGQAGSLGCCTSSLMETELVTYMIRYGTGHQQVIPLEESDRWPLQEQLTRLRQQMERVAEDPPSGFHSNTRVLLVHDREELHAEKDADWTGDFPLFHCQKPAEDFNILDTLFRIQGLSPGKSFQEILTVYTLLAAEAIFEGEELGSIEPGKIPGLNLLLHTEPGTFRLTEESSLRVLA